MNNSKENFQGVADMLKSKLAQITGALAILTALTIAVPKSAEAQTLVNKKQYGKILEKAEADQDSIGEKMAQFTFGGGIERGLQLDIQKQNNKNGDTLKKGDFSLFKNKLVESMNAKQEIEKKDEKGNVKMEATAIDAKILNKQEMELRLWRTVDSLTTNDVASFYKSFQEYEKSGVNLVGNKKGKGKLAAGWNLASFPVNENIDYLEKNKKIPYTKAQQEELQRGLETIYETELSKWKAEALENRKSMKKPTYESANLIALEKAREEIAKRIYEKYIQPIVEKVFTQFYSAKDDKRGQ